MKNTLTILDPSQQHVFESIVDENNNSDISVVYGPPGTGKSHLIVSLLFELALRKNKILFISQNTEALEVVGRMINKAERSIGITDQDHLSFADFCLKLNRTTNRRLKYIQMQNDRVQTKTVDKLSVFNRQIDLESNPYKLSYVSLDRSNNYNLSDQDPLGLDELLFNYLKNVHDGKIISSAFHDFTNINIRKIFKLLNDYDDKNNLFQFNNNPTNALKFLNKYKTDVTLSEIQSKAQDLVNVIANLDQKYKENITANSDISIKDFINYLYLLIQFSPYLNIQKIQEVNLDIAMLINDLQEIVSSNLILDRSVVKLNTAGNNETIFADFKDQITIGLFNDIRDIETNSQKILSAVKNLDELKINRSIDLNKIIKAAFNNLDIDIDSLNYFDGINSFTARDFNELIKELKEYQKTNFLVASFKKKAKIFEQLKSDIKNQDIKILIDNIDVFETLEAILQNTNLTIRDFNNLSEQHKNYNSAYNPLNDVDHEYDIKILNTILTLRDLLQNYSFALENYNLETTASLFTKCINDINKFKDIVENNISLASEMPTTDLIKNINANIKNESLLKIISQKVNLYRNIIFTKNNDLNEFIKTSELIIKVAKSNLNETILAFSNVLFKDNIQGLDGDVLNHVKDVILDVINSDFFNQSTFIMHKGDNLTKFINRYDEINLFNNLDEFDSFIQQNKFIDEIKSLFGEQNIDQIDQLLNNEFLTYDKFKEKIVSDLVNSKYKSLPIDSRKRINTDEDSGYFKRLEQEVTSDRHNYFINGLKSLRLLTEPAASRLKYSKNWISSGSVMEKIRANFELILGAFPIVVATPKEVSKYIKAKKDLFDYVIFDEASQMLPGQALPSIYRAKKAVIVGDPHQMPPTLTTSLTYENSSEDLEDENDDTSILDVIIPLAESKDKHYLKVHYRSMYNKLFDPSLKAIYASEGVRAIQEAKSDNMPISIKDDLGNNDNDNFDHISTTIYEKLNNDPDATFCLLFTRNDRKIDYVNYLSYQSNSIVGKSIYQLIESGKLLISTVTNCQGIEGTHSIIYFNYYDNPGAMWFFNEKAGAYKRLNVSITRQVKSLTLLMGNTKGKWLETCQRFLDNSNTTPNRAKSAELMLYLLQNAGEEIDVNYLDRILGPNSNNIDSPLTEELYNMLLEHYKDKLDTDMKIWCEVGYKLNIPDSNALNKTRESVGFRIDLGIYSIRQQRFVLGIEMDGAMWHSGANKEFNDLKRQEILENKGWNIYRIWSTNWLNSTRQEFNNLVNVIDTEMSRPIQDKSIVNLKQEFINENQTNKEIDFHNIEKVKEKTRSVNKELLEYLKKHELEGTKINIKYNKPGMLINEAKFQSMYIESLKDDYILVSFDEDNQLSYKYKIDRILEYK